MLTQEKYSPAELAKLNKNKLNTQLYDANKYTLGSRIG